MSARLYLSMYFGSFDSPDAETIVLPVPARLMKLLPKAYDPCADVPPSKLTRDLKWAYLHRVWVRSSMRRGGHGTKILVETLETTDELGLSLVLRCAPFDDLRGSKRKLRAWYTSHGFRSLGGSRPDIMVRKF